MKSTTTFPNAAAITKLLPLTAASLLSLSLLLLTCTLPTDPALDPKNAVVSLLVNNKPVANGSIVLNQGDSLKIGLEISLPKHIEKIAISSSCGIIDSTITPATATERDTIPFSLNFGTTGACSVFVKATLKDGEYKDKADTLAFMILAGKSTIKLSPASSSVITRIGKIDTLLFTTHTIGGPLSPAFTVAAVPAMNSTRLYPLVSPTGDTVRVVFIPSVAETCTVMLKATAASSGTGTISDSAFVGVRVYAPLAPVAVNAPQTIAAGTADTLVFAVDNNTRPDTLSIGLCNRSLLPASIFTVIPTEKDTLRIAVSPATTSTTGSFAIGIRTETALFNDTTWFPLTFIDKSTSFWNKTDTTVSTVEGTAFQLDLRPFLISPRPASITFSTTTGTVSSDTIWKWTPLWGGATPETAIVTAKNSNATQNLKLLINVTPGDTGKPTIRLLDNALSGKKIGSSQLTIECVVIDREAGVGKVTFVQATQSVDATVRNDSIYTAAISGLTHGAVSQISISATDKSIRQNKTTLSFSVTYDSTISDAEPPIITRTSGLTSGDRITKKTGSIAYSISDKSGIDSVWWTLNDSSGGALTIGTDGKYTINYVLPKSGENTVTLFARDGSTAKNSGRSELKLILNTQLSPVTNVFPAKDTTGIPTEPTFTWTGGDDVDGDTVYSVVFYGTSSGSLLPTPETKGKNFTLPGSLRLSANRQYVWQVLSYTKTPFADTVKSTITSFTTIGTAPQITAQPAPTLSIIEGQPLTLTVTVSGNPPPKCQWYKNNQLLPGDTTTTFTKSASIPADSGSYHVTASNGIGTEAVSNKSIVTVRITAKIIEEPISVTVNEDSSAKFSVKAVGEAPLSYQWLRDGLIITTGGTTTTYTIPTVTPADNNKKFRCIVANSFSRDTSTEALLTVTTAPQCTVTFAMDGGSPDAARQIIKSGQKAVRPATDPTKAGYAFGGWYSSSTATTEFDFTVAITASRTIYAKWVPVYTVTYHENGGTGAAPVDSKKYRSTELASVLDKPAGLIRSGYDFVGWTLSDGGTGTVYSVGNTITIGSTGVDLFAKWQVSGPPVFTTTLTDKNCPVNDSVTFTVAATGLNLTYEWRKNGTKIDGASTTNYTTSALTVDDLTVAATYSCKVSNTGGNVTSSATLTVSTLTDVDGNVYHQVKIGAQVWTIENMLVTKYNDGITAIPKDTLIGNWTETTPKFCYYGNTTNSDTIKKFGALYNWYVVDPTNANKIAPVGWHVPTVVEWTILQNHLIGNGFNWDGSTTGNKFAKSMASKADWNSSTTAGAVGNNLSTNNATGFSALPAGICTNNGFNTLLEQGYWWTSTESNASTAILRYIFYDAVYLQEMKDIPKTFGFSIRLVKN